MGISKTEKRTQVYCFLVRIITVKKS
jgi:hypothetical protein